jgi:DNA-binding NarL/FixJ family response regulator
MINVAIADDHSIVLNGLQKILALHTDIKVTDVYLNGDSLLEGLETKQPDVLLLDIQMPGKNGIELAGIISKKFPDVKMIALTNVDILVQVKKMLQKGCLGYLLKDASPEILIEAIKTVHTGEQFLYESLSKQLVNNFFSQNSKQLTRREKEILQLITEEHTNQEIADKLFLSLRTVENHRNNLLQKLDVKNTAGLVKIAIQEGLVK